MGFIGFLGLICVLWALYQLAKNSNESLGQQKQIIEELRLLRSAAERIEAKQLRTEVSNSEISKIDQKTQSDVAGSKADTLVSINDAGIDVLQTLPGVGKVLAQKIIDGRPYGSIEDLAEVSGISQELLSKLKSSIRL